MTNPYDSEFEKQAEALLGIKKNTTLKLTYHSERTYKPDFVDETNKVLYEGKGYFKPEDRRKMREVRDQHPDWSFVLVFQNPNNKLTRTSTTTYAKWAEKNGFEWLQAIPVKITRDKHAPAFETALMVWCVSHCAGYHSIERTDGRKTVYTATFTHLHDATLFKLTFGGAA